MLKNLTLLSALALSSSSFSYDDLVMGESVLSEVLMDGTEMILEKTNTPRMRPNPRGLNPNAVNLLDGEKQWIEAADKIIDISGNLVALGEDVYSLVKKGEPSININTTPISVLPKAMDGETIYPLAVSGTNPEPMVKKYRYTQKNVFGWTMIDFTWKIVFSYGSSIDGVGAYIIGAEIVPEHIDVKYGYSIDVAYKLKSISNDGSSDDTLAAATLAMTFKVQNTFRSVLFDKQYKINGNGNVLKL